MGYMLNKAAPGKLSIISAIEEISVKKFVIFLEMVIVFVFSTLSAAAELKQNKDKLVKSLMVAD